jgi:predicted metalloprotease with PDZ domain
MPQFAPVEKRPNVIALSRLMVAFLVLLICGVGAAALFSRHSPLVPVFGPSEETTVDQLEEAIGATVEPLDPATARSLGLTAGTRGVVVTSLATGGPAARAGVRTGDVVVAIDRPVGSVNDLAAGVRNNANVLTVTLNRRGQSVIVPLAVDAPGGEAALFKEGE